MYIALIFYSITLQCTVNIYASLVNTIERSFYIISMITIIFIIIIYYQYYKIIKPISNVPFTIFYHCIHFIVEGLLYTKINIYYYNVLLGLHNLLRNDIFV